ncbi:hypothetical protein Droror1_Dr00020771 [Drosera rotundifolia]
MSRRDPGRGRGDSDDSKRAADDAMGEVKVIFMRSDLMRRWRMFIYRGANAYVYLSSSVSRLRDHHHTGAYSKRRGCSSIVCSTTPPRQYSASSSPILPSSASLPVASPYSTSSPSATGTDDEYVGGYRLGLTWTQ